VQAGSVSAQIVLHREAGLTTNTKPKQQKRGRGEKKKQQEKDKTELKLTSHGGLLADGT